MFLTLNLKQTKILKISCQKSLFPVFSTRPVFISFQFEDTNVEFDAVLHPMFGPIGCIVATQLIPRKTSIL